MNQIQKLRENTRKLEMLLNNINQTDCCCREISNAQCFALVEIGRKPNISVKELAEIIRVDKSGISRTVEELVRKKLVERKPSKEDRRYVVLNLTEDGNEIFSRIEEDMNIRFKQILELIPQEKRESVIEALELYNGVLESEKDRNHDESCSCCSKC